MMQLLVDIGNSRFKWQSMAIGGVGHSAGHSAAVKAVASGALVHGEEPLAAYLDAHWAGFKAAQCWACSVADAAIARDLDNWCLNHWGFKALWATAKNKQLGVNNLYTQPQTLGSDRWMALLGARHKYAGQALCVVDAGSAITVDALSAAGDFLGGTIMPGRNLMQQALGAALGHNMAQLRLPDLLTKRGVVLEVPLNVRAKSTAQALFTGIELTLQAGVSRIIEAHLIKQQNEQSEQSEMKIIITGGGALSLKLPYTGVVHAPDLVFEGLNLIAQEANLA